jgi:hypothetical protein
MKFDFKECRALLLAAVLAELEACKSTILKIPGYEAGGSEFRCLVSAICLDIAPWHRGFDLALRDDDEKRDERIRNSVGDWKLYPLRGIDDPPTTPQRVAVEEFFEREYSGIKNPEVAREIAHLMFLAAAEALLDYSVTRMLRRYQIDAPYVDDTFLPHRCFEYIVTDSDTSIAANYCEIVIANRITQRLKLRREQSTD